MAIVQLGIQNTPRRHILSNSVASTWCHELALRSARMASFEYRLGDPDVKWHGSLEDVIRLDVSTVGDQVMRHNRRDGEAWLNELAEMLVGPLISCITAGVSWSNYEVEHRLEDTHGNSLLIVIKVSELVQGDRAIGITGVVADAESLDGSRSEAGEIVEMYEQLVELSPDAIIVHQRGRVVLANSAAAQKVELATRRDLVGRPITDFLEGTSASRTFERISTLAQKGAVTPPAETVLVTSSGRRKHFATMAVKTTWLGEPAFQVILRDLTDQQRANIRYQSLAERYSAVVEALEEGIIVVDPMGNNLAINDAASRVFGPALLEGKACPLLDENISVVIDNPGQIVVDGIEAQYRAEHPIMKALRTGEPETGIHVLLRVPTYEGDRTGSVAAVGLDGREDGQDTAEAIDDVMDLTLPECEAGSLRWLMMNCQPISRESELDASAVVCSFTDVTERRRTEDELTYRANYDSLTRLPNRTQFLDILAACLDDGAVGGGGSGSSVAVLFLDIDRFKIINDTCGHHVGDEVISLIGRRIADMLLPEETLGRMSGDEFAICISPAGDISSVQERAHEFASAISKPLTVSTGRRFTLSVSVGIGNSDRREMSADELLIESDLAMYRAKQAGKGRVEVFGERLRADMRHRVTVEEQLRAGIERDQLVVYYQPIISLEQNRIVGAESLVRWNHPGWGLVSPNDFIAIAEECGLIGSVGMSVLEKAVEEAASWQRKRLGSEVESSLRRPKAPSLADPNKPHVSVNFSAHQLTYSSTVGQIKRVLADKGLPPECLWVEITETVLLEDTAHAMSVLREIRDMGVRLVLDDFGTGYSALSYLKTFPVDAIKIDRTFVAGIGQTKGDEAIVKATIGLAHALGLEVIAEGVETEDQLSMLANLSCEYYQGFLKSRPVPGPRFRSLLSAL